MNNWKNEDVPKNEIETQQPLLGSWFRRTMVISPQITKDGDKSENRSDQLNNNTTNDICFSLTGEWGWWQLRTALIVFLTKIPAAWFMACIIFTAPAPRDGEYECDVNSVARDLGLSPNVSYEHPMILEPDGSYSQNYCKLFINSTQDNYFKSVACDHFIFHIPKKTTVISQFDLVCSESILVAITQCFHLLGVLLGGVIATELMSFFSPRRVMIIGMILQIGLGIGTGHIVLLWLHMAFRTMAAATCAITFTSGNVIMMDITGGKYKTIVAANFEQFWSVGVILLPAIGYLTNFWGEIYMAISVPTTFIVIFWWFLPDSPRWHLQKENIETAREILLKGREINKVQTNIPDNLDSLLKRKAMDIIYEISKDTNSSWKQLLSIKGSPWRILCVVTAWSLLYTCYYGTLLNIRSFGRDYLLYTTPIAGTCELIGGFLGFVLLMKLKQKWAVMGIIVSLSGFVTFSIWILPTHVDGSHMFLDLMFIQMVNKIGINAALCLAYTCTAELFPAHHKRRVVYTCTVITRIIFMTAPLIGFTAIFGDAVTLTTFGGLSVVVGFFLMFLSPLKNGESNNQNNIFTSTIKTNQLST